MTREETVRNLLTELIDMIDNGSQRDLDRADEIGASIIKLFEQEPILDKVRAEILEEHESAFAREDNDTAYGLSVALEIIDKYKAEMGVEDGSDD